MPATPSPTTGMRATMRFSTTGCRARASSRMAVPSTAATRPKTMAHRNMAPVGWLNGGRPGMASEKLPNPVSESRPMKMRVPMPAASSPGTSTRPRSGPPSPDASIRRKAATMGEPSRALMAAKLPAEAITTAAVGGASFLTRCTARAPSPPPMAMSGASGPRTTPRLRVASEARITPGSSTAVGAPPALNPSAGLWPAVPGRYWMVAPTRRPAMARMGSGHHTGVPAKPSSLGSEVKNQFWRRATNLRKK